MTSRKKRFFVALGTGSFSAVKTHDSSILKVSWSEFWREREHSLGRRKVRKLRVARGDSLEEMKVPGEGEESVEGPICRHTHTHKHTWIPHYPTQPTPWFSSPFHRRPHQFFCSVDTFKASIMRRSAARIPINSSLDRCVSVLLVPQCGPLTSISKHVLPFILMKDTNSRGTEHRNIKKCNKFGCLIRFPFFSSPVAGAYVTPRWTTEYGM